MKNSYQPETKYDFEELLHEAREKMKIESSKNVDEKHQKKPKMIVGVYLLQ